VEDHPIVTGGAIKRAAASGWWAIVHASAAQRSSCSLEVVVLGLEPIVPGHLTGGVELGLRLLG